MAPVLVMGILFFCGLGTAALAEELNIANGDIHITETGYRQGQSQQIAYTGPYTVTGTGSGAIVVESGAHDITISNLQITASGTPAIQVDAGATLRLTVEGENRLTGDSGFAGICVAPAYDAQWHYDADASGKLYLSGDGTLGAMGGAGDAVSGTCGGGAGIGSGYPTANQDRSVAFHISITNGASVRAFGGYHAQAIGYGYRPTDYTGYGITLELDDSIFLWAQNADYYQPALAAATKYNAALHQLFQRQPLSDGLYGRRQKCLRSRQPSGARLPGPAVRRSRRVV